MKRLVVIVLLMVLLFGSATTFAQSGRDYYNEIYKAGGLDRMADGYACFDDDPKLETFFIFGKAKLSSNSSSAPVSSRKCQKHNRWTSTGVS